MGRKKIINGEAVPEEKSPAGYFEEPLECILTDAERQERGIMLADVDKRIDAKDAERREVAKGFSTVLKTLKAERAPLIEAVETGKDTRLIKCHEIHNFERNNVTVIRVDTQAVVRERAMEPHEREKHAQPSLIDDVAQGSA